jgi:hypothetical protein
MGFLDKVKGTAKQAVNPGGRNQIDFEPTVHPAAGEDYPVATSQSMHEMTLKGSSRVRP